ncbi:hypothetical protein KKF84_19865 [Myxococcota bacterium]|nr:hypothetical protein [Myxococcota bacterium]
MNSPHSIDLLRASITKSDDKYIVADLHSEESLIFSDILDAQAAALLIESGVTIAELDESMILQFKIQLIRKTRTRSVN